MDILCQHDVLGRWRTCLVLRQRHVKGGADMPEVILGPRKVHRVCVATIRPNAEGEHRRLSMLGFAPVHIRVPDSKVPSAATRGRGAVGSDLRSTLQSIVMRITHG